MVNRMETKNLQGATTPPRFKDFHELVEALKIDIPTEFGDVMTNRDGHVVKRTYLTKFTKLPKNAQPIAILETQPIAILGTRIHRNFTSDSLWKREDWASP